MYAKRPVLVAWLVVTLLILFGFNNCSQVVFSLSSEAMQQEVNLLSTESSLQINGGAPYTNQKVVQLTLNSTRGVEMKIANQSDCSDGSWEPYTTAKTWTLSKDNRQVSVYALFKNLRGDISQCILANIIHDDIPPVAAYSNPTGLMTNVANLKLIFAASDALSGLDHTKCVDGSGTAIASCGSPYDVTVSQDGVKSFSIQATDKAGNVSPTVVYSWMFDQTPPTVVINSQPAARTGSSNAEFTLSASDALSGIDKTMCRIDGGAYQACLSPQPYPGLSAGAHTFEVYATDHAGNSSAVVSATWTIDSAAPTIQFTQTPPLNSKSPLATFGFTGQSNGQEISYFECQTDGAAYAPCTSLWPVPGLSQGSHTFSVRGRDSYNNFSLPISYTWLVDLTPPVVRITTGPSGLGHETTATFQWTATDTPSGIKTVECRLDGAAFQLCPTGSAIYTNLVEGPHTFEVRATDQAGNVGSDSRSFSLDLIPPVVTITSAPANYVSILNPQFVFSATDASGIAGYECRVDNGSYAACTSPYTATNVNEGGHVFYVRATDNAENTSLPATASWNLDLSPPIINVILAPGTLGQGQHAIVQYQVVDPASGVDSVQCGITSPTGTVVACQTAETKDLGVLGVGSYTFKIHATDKVGNEITEDVSFTVTSQTVVCDPFTPNSNSTCHGGLVGNIYYLDSAHRTIFRNLANKTVDYFLSDGIRQNVILNLNQLYVPTRSFQSGFPTTGGDLLKDNNGNILFEYFAFDLNTVLKLDAANDQAGWYQFATLSDDGTMVLMTPSGGSTSTLIANDGDHPTRMGCSSSAVYFDDTTRLGLRIKYYQGPQTEIALTMMWKKVSGPTAALDSHCGHSGNSTFFGPNYNDFSTQREFGQLIQGGWRVVAPANFIAPAN